MYHIDLYGLVFGGSVILIACSVFIFSYYYIYAEKFFLRFHLLLILFVISIIFLIFSLNIFSLILGWDGLGLTSFLLVLYYQSGKSFNSALLTFLSNRVGDVLILISIYYLHIFGSYNFMLRNKSGFMLILVVIAARFTKSAQMPFSA